LTRLAEEISASGKSKRGERKSLSGKRTRCAGRSPGRGWYRSTGKEGAGKKGINEKFSSE
jgi:hypothetical protein